MSTCNVCCEKFNKSSRAAVTCEFCSFDACIECIKRFTLSQKNVECMNCHKGWNRQSQSLKFTRAFMNKELKVHREQVLYERELSALPATQVYVERLLEKRRRTVRIDEIHKEMQKLKAEKEFLLSLDKDGDDQPSRKEFVQPCASQTCRGFVSTQYKCGICEKFTCRDCFELKDDDHKCDPSTVENVKSLRQETVPCPKCGARIFKIGGCDQMFCVQCHVPFSWKTGRLETGNIHNPHYFEWLRQQGGGVAPRNPNDIQCGREMDGYLANRQDRINRIRIQNLIEIRQYLLPTFRTDHLENNVGLRMKLLMNEIDDAKFRVLLQRAEKKVENYRDNSQLLDMFLAAATDIYYRDDHTMNVELTTLVNYVNKSFQDISRLYNSKIFVINPETFQPSYHNINKHYL